MNSEELKPTHEPNSSNLESELKQTQAPQRELTFGEKAAGVSFNPSNLPEVDQLKAAAAEFIDQCNILRGVAVSGEAKRYYSKAISHMEDAQMNAVKAATWRG